MPTLMAVHAHPDDEGIQTGGVLAMYASRGIKTVLVTCTNGEMGDSPDGLKPDKDGHDTAATSELRLSELREAARALSIGSLELLGYRDSGMMGWPQNDDPASFWRVPLDEATARIAALMERHQPEVVITYDANGLYGHPDHIQASRATFAAAERTGIPQKVYEIAFPLSVVKGWAAMQREQGTATTRNDGGSLRDPRRADHHDHRRRLSLGREVGVGDGPQEPGRELRLPEGGPRAPEGRIRHRAFRAPGRHYRGAAA
jgi:LmbE family N-acetylglucosaminyl deacetylase